MNRRIYIALFCYTVGVLGNSAASLTLFHFRVFDAVESLEFGVMVGVLIGLFLAALFWGRL